MHTHTDTRTLLHTHSQASIQNADTDATIDTATAADTTATMALSE